MTNEDKKRLEEAKTSTLDKSRLAEIRNYNLSDIVGSAGSTLKDIKFLLAQIDKRDEALRRVREQSCPGCSYIASDGGEG